METDFKKTADEASEAILKEMINKFGVIFMSNYDDVDRGTPLYVALIEFDGEIKPSPIFPRHDMAETFVQLCQKFIPNFSHKKVKIYKLEAV